MKRFLSFSPYAHLLNVLSISLPDCRCSEGLDACRLDLRSYPEDLV